jgi:outer membrane protein assembly factor BamB
MNRPNYQLTPFLYLFLAVISSFLLSCTSNVSSSSKSEIAQWRGSDRNGIYHETELLDVWPENGPELLWMYEGIGKGYAAPTVLGDKIFVNGEQDSMSYLFAFDLSGHLLWKAENGKEFMGDGFSATYPGSRSTPTIVNDLVYTTSGKGRIACFDVASGEEKWAVEIVNDLDGTEPYFGYSESVVIDKNKLFCFAGGEKNNTLALDRYNGEIIWSATGMQDTFSYCSPILVQLPDKNVLVTHSRHYLYTINTENGNILGSRALDYKYDGEHCNSPLYSDGAIYFVSNEKNDGALRLNINAEGALTEQWKNPNIKNNFNGYVKVDDKLFTMIKGNKLLSIDSNSGVITDSIKAATGSIIYADNKFICYGMNGDVSLITYNEDGFQLKSNFKVNEGSGQHFAHPVLNNGVMYIRHGNTLLAYRVK